MAAKVLFNASEDKILIEMVAKFPCLFDVGSDLHKNQVVKKNAWKEVAEAADRSVEDCKKRWRNIKDTYLRRQKSPGTRSAATSKSKKWDMLGFLDKVDHTRGTITNIDDVNNLTGNPPTPNPPSSKRPKRTDKLVNYLEERRKDRSEVFKKISSNNEEDEIEVFFKSIVMSVRKLSPELIREAKLKTLQMVCELESRNSQASVPELEVRGAPVDAARSTYVPSPAESSIHSFSSRAYSENSSDGLICGLSS